MDRALFPDLPVMLAPQPRAGCAKPIGKRGAAPRRVVRARRAPRVQQLAELRRQMLEHFDAVLAELGALRQQRRDAGELPHAILSRLVAIERHLGTVEQPQAPRVSRRRPLGVT